MITTKLTSRLPAMRGQVRRAVGAQVRTSALAIEADIKAQMAEPKSGHIRESDGHVASAPGEPPAIDSGAYVNDVRSAFPGELSAIVGTNQEQAELLEYGGAEIAARPVWETAAEAERPKFERGIAQALKDLK